MSIGPVSSTKYTARVFHTVVYPVTPLWPDRVDNHVESLAIYLVPVTGSTGVKVCPPLGSNAI